MARGGKEGSGRDGCRGDSEERIGKERVVGRGLGGMEEARSVGREGGGLKREEDGSGEVGRGKEERY